MFPGHAPHNGTQRLPPFDPPSAPAGADADEPNSSHFHPGSQPCEAPFEIVQS